MLSVVSVAQIQKLKKKKNLERQYALQPCLFWQTEIIEMWESVRWNTIIQRKWGGRIKLLYLS